jgi:toxin ParE1/3/4
MTYTVIILGPAEADLNAIYEYIAERASADIAARFVGRIETYLLGFSNTPERGTRRDDLRPGLRTVGFQRRAIILFEVNRAQRQVLIHGIYYAGRSFEGMTIDDGDQ